MSFQAYCQDSAKLLEESGRHIDAVRVQRAIDAICGALLEGKALLVCGNGGSAADAMHITGELVGRFLKDRRPLKAICLIDNPALLTAWSNDYGYEGVFARQVEGFGEKGGVLLGLSTSGNSPSVVRAFEQGRKMGMTTIGLTGQGGGALAGLCDILLDVPSRSTPAIQQVHSCLYHYLCEMVEARCAP